MDRQLGDPGPVTPEILPDAAAGELLTLQQAAYIGEARAHRNFDLPPLLDTLDDIRAALADPSITVWGFRDGGRLVASVRMRLAGEVGEVGRLVVAPDRHGEGLGTALLTAAENATPPEVTVFRLCTGERSAGPRYLYGKLGYRETHRTPEADYHLVHLEKPRVRASG
ncbi:GNAT family N-acetyltransferase [Amycolatopsis benzoatilytica]|uniref:GNAT family N-acetyltransferase n=1 Tax=Amycolatopsis benzoatilytica TaxID=346045 RepID=UPI000366A88E|nr:GNAT family N-acetyltransferase [Amycolatopsis benzoatilytica]